jgi:hypothetical protein
MLLYRYDVPHISTYATTCAVLSRQWPVPPLLPARSTLPSSTTIVAECHSIVNDNDVNDCHASPPPLLTLRSYLPACRYLIATYQAPAIATISTTVTDRITVNPHRYYRYHRATTVTTLL